MTLDQAVSDMARKLYRLNDRELLAGLPTLRDQDRTWGEWSMELQARLNHLVFNGPSQDILDAIGALVIVMKLRLADQQQVSATSGEAA